MDEYHIENYIVSVGYSRNEEVTKRVLNSILDYNLSNDKCNKIIYCYTISNFMSSKGIEDEQKINTDLAVIGLTDCGLVLSYDSLNVDKEFVFKLIKTKGLYTIR